MEEKKKYKPTGFAKKVIFKDVTVDIVMSAALMVDRYASVHAMVLSGKFKVAVRFRSQISSELEPYRDCFGGYWSEQVKEDGQIFYWLNLQQRRFFKFMELVLPYLVVKKEHVEAIFAYRDMVKENRNRRLTPEVLEARKKQMNTISYWRRESWRRGVKLGFRDKNEYSGSKTESEGLL